MKINRASFDVFDTLLWRPFAKPTDLFAFVALTCPARSVFGIRVPFRPLRIFAERLARRIQPKHDDITLNEIYRLLAIIIKNTDELKQAELAAETRFCTPLTHGIELFQHCTRNGYRPIAVSDMYLPSLFITHLLQKNGVMPEAVYVSSEYGLTKSTGNLFKKIMHDHGDEPSTWMHVGDNPYSDQIIPGRLGISIIPFTPPMPNRLCKSLLGSAMAALSCKCEIDHFWHRLGFELCAPVSVGFARFINKSLIKSGIRKVFFLGRDSYLFKMAFDKFFPQYATTYLEISRRMLLLPSIFELDTFNINRLLEGANLKVRDVFYRIGLDCPTTILPDALIDDCRSEVATALREAGQTLLSRCSDERSQLLVYLQEMGFFGKVAIVDLGWHGTIQKSLEDIAARIIPDLHIHGIYFGTINTKVTHADAYFFDNDKPFSHRSLVYQSLALIEFVFTEPVHTLEKVTYINGVRTIIRIDNEPDTALNIRKEISAGTRASINKFSKHFHPDDFSDNEYQQYTRSILKTYFCHPNPKTLMAFSKLTHADGFGRSPVRSIVDTSDNPSLLQSYIQSFWRTGYLMHLNGPKKLPLLIIHTALYSDAGQILYAILYRLRVFYRHWRKA